jgi:hypothetical protein
MVPAHIIIKKKSSDFTKRPVFLLKKTQWRAA